MCVARVSLEAGDLRLLAAPARSGRHLRHCSAGSGIAHHRLEEVPDLALEPAATGLIVRESPGEVNRDGFCAILDEELGRIFVCPVHSCSFMAL
jgi:hypothetical protein